jgi:hypothetical protein
VSGGPRVLYHALGGGLGHLVRAGRFLHTQGLADDALVLSASEHAGDAWLSAGVAVRCVPPALAHDLPALRTWLAQAIAEFAPHVVCVDSFPAGLLGEMAGLAESPALKGVALWHVARLLRWNAYAPLLAGAPRYSLAWRLEPLQPPHEHWLREHADAVRDCRMAPPASAPQGLADGRPFWLVAHSGPAQEVRELIALAREQRRIENANVALAVASFDPPRPLPADCQRIAAAPLAGWYAAAQRIFGAAGFNFIAETQAWRDKRVVLPFPRRYDDQFERARRSRLA